MAIKNLILARGRLGGVNFIPTLGLSIPVALFTGPYCVQRANIYLHGSEAANVYQLGSEAANVYRIGSESANVYQHGTERSHIYKHGAEAANVSCEG